VAPRGLWRRAPARIGVRTVGRGRGPSRAARRLRRGLSQAVRLQPGARKGAAPASTVRSRRRRRGPARTGAGGGFGAAGAPTERHVRRRARRRPRPTAARGRSRVRTGAGEGVRLLRGGRQRRSGGGATVPVLWAYEAAGAGEEK
jgi:hypothetical protein